MTVLQTTPVPTRSLLLEVVEDPNTVPRYVTGGTSGSSSPGGMAQMGKADTLTLDGSFRSYGNGNVRLVLGAAQTRVQTLAFRALSLAEKDTLMALAGHTVLYCDTYGRRVFGAYLAPVALAIPHSGGLFDVSISLQSVGYDEAV